MNKIFIIGWNRPNVNSIDLAVSSQFTTDNPFDPGKPYSANPTNTIPVADPVSNDVVIATMKAAFPVAEVALMPAPEPPVEVAPVAVEDPPA